MLKVLRSLVIIVLFVSLAAVTAHAGVLGKVKSWFTSEVVAFLVSGILVIIGGAFGIMFRKITRTFKEAGEFLTILGLALEDQRITRKELADIVKEGREIFAVWK